MKQSNRSQQLQNLPSSSLINWSKYEFKHYLHFDDRLDIKHVKKKIQDPNWVSSHAFLPFIHFSITFNKYVSIPKDKIVALNQRKEKRKKVRQIYYAAHKDRYIYKYYGDLLNYAYNVFARKHGIDDIALAYRNNKSGKNNIDFAYEVFDFLFNQNQAVVISIDFTEFFDHIDHQTLKQNIKTILGVEELPMDWYKVFKNLTQFSYVHKYDVDDFLKQKYGVKKLKELKKTKKLRKIMTPNEFRNFKESNYLFKNKKPYGIPQGSGMSAVSSNVHLIHFDQEMNQWAKKYQALYRRYCDDLILVIPVTRAAPEVVELLKKEVLQIIKGYHFQGLKIQEKKTEISYYSNDMVFDESQKQSTIDYLGFVTNGQSIKVREKSLFKYYTRAYRKANTSKRISLATKRKGPRKKLYKIYSHLGINYKDRGNFITYAYKAHSKMNKLAHSHIRKQVKRHWNKIHKRLE